MAGHETTPRQLDVRELRDNLADFLRQTRNGSSFLITSQDEVLAEIRPPSDPIRQRREPGVLRGKINMSPDFDSIPPDFLAAMEGDIA